MAHRTLFVALLGLGLGCSAQKRSAAHTDGITTAQGDSADTFCDVVLRTAYVNLEGRAGPQSNCSTGICWAIVNGTFDISAGAQAAAVEPGVLYQSAHDNQWRQAAATAIWGAGLGYRRYSFAIDHDTFTSPTSGSAPPEGSVVRLIPFVRTPAGGRVFDHNRVADLSAAYLLTPENNWQIQQDASCAAAPPHGIRTLVFATGWQNSGYGALVQSGKLDINYDIERIPSGLYCTHDGVPTYAVTAYVQFEPSGALLSERIDGPLNLATGQIASVPLEFDVPTHATSAALWFLDSSECNGDQWDSNYGTNYTYPVAAEQ